MFKHACVVVSVVALAMGVMASLAPSPALAASPEGLESDAQAALKSLYGSTPTAKTLGDAAKGILVFPNIVKAGFIFGAQYGEGELLRRDQIAGYYNIAAASFGLQAGIQGYAFIFGQKGLMAGIGLQGSKITRVSR